MKEYDFNGYKLRLHDTGRKEKFYGKAIVSYEFEAPEGNILFSGEDYYSPPMCKPESYDSAISLLGFLILKVGDTDEEYFQNYTLEQIAFSESWDCEELAYIICDHENKEG